MTTISNRDRAEALAMFEAFHGGAPIALSDGGVRRWLAVRDHVLAAHECKPVWRPTTADEIQAGWEVRSRGRGGIEMNWGIAHHRDLDGDWRTEAGAVLTAFTLSWTYETTTAPLPEPEPASEPETIPTIDPEPVDLGYLSDRARAYVVGLEARLRRLREENDDLRAKLNDPSRTDEKHIKAAYKRGWADASSAMDAAASSATRALADLRRAAADAWMTEPDTQPEGDPHE